MSDTDNSATRQLGALAVRAWRWARGCLSALVSDLSAPRAGDSESPAVLVISGGGCNLLARRKGQFEPLGQGGSIDAVAAAARQTLSRAEQQRLALRFAEDRAIVQDMQLPESARPLLGAILRNKIESLAPWPVEDTAWGYATGDVTRAGTVPVTIGIIGRRALAAPLAALAHVGIKPSRVEIATGDTAIVIDHSSDIRRRKVSTALRMALGTLAILIAAGGAYGGLLWWRDTQELAAIDARTEQLKQELAGRNDAAGDNGQVAEAIKLVDGKKAERPMVAVIDELTKAIPNGSWLTAIDFVDGTLTLQGRGGPPTELIKSLESAPAFTNVNFAAATQHDEQAGADVFAISATLEPIEAAP